MSFENATPRPWTKNNTYGWLEGANGTRVTVYDLGISVSMNRPDEEERTNAELIVTAVNAHDLMRTALENSAQALRFVLTEFDPPADAHHQLSYDLELVEAALKLARVET